MFILMPDRRKGKNTGKP